MTAGKHRLTHSAWINFKRVLYTRKIYNGGIVVFRTLPAALTCYGTGATPADAWAIAPVFTLPSKCITICRKRRVIMQNDVLRKYAQVLVDYSTDVQKGDLVVIRTDSVESQPLLKEIYKRVIERGGNPIVRIALEGAGGQTRSLSSQSGSGGIGGVKRAWLGQNAPNPFGSSADVRLSVPSDAKSATLCVYDMTGKQLRQIVVTDRGETSVSLSADGLSAGMYLYSLIVDGSLIDTKRMVVAE